MTHKTYPIPKGTYTAQFIDADFYRGDRKNISRKAHEEVSKVKSLNYALSVSDDSGNILGTINGGMPIKYPLSHNSPIIRFSNTLNMGIDEFPKSLIGKKVTIISNLTNDPNLGMKAFVEEFLPHPENLLHNDLNEVEELANSGANQKG